jgi:large subunit ribosomal protein L22
MQAKAIARYIRVTPRKADQVLQLIRGKRVDQATEILDFTPKHVAKVIGKVMKSAVANAVAMEGKINIEHMHVKEAVAQAGPTLKRFLPRAQGRATPILKRTCHILVVVEGDVVDVPAPSRRGVRTAKAAAPTVPVTEGTKAPARKGRTAKTPARKGGAAKTSAASGGRTKEA